MLTPKPADVAAANPALGKVIRSVQTLVDEINEASRRPPTRAALGAMRAALAHLKGLAERYPVFVFPNLEQVERQVRSAEFKHRNRRR